MNSTLTKVSTISSQAIQQAIELVEVTKRYGEATVLENISLEIHSGEFLVLLGPSGCGKSTILKIIAGLEDATDGEVYIHGRLANYLAPKERDVSMVFQNYALYPHMTVERNIGFPLKMRRTAKAEIREQVVSVARLLEIEQFLGKFPDQLSGGQRQRVALGRALIRNPIAFLLDEPLSNLDALLRVQMREELIKFHREVGRTIVYVTHDQVEAMTMANRIVVLKQGTIQQVGRPREVYMQPANTFVATFVGSPQMNLISGTLQSVESGLDFVGPFRFPLGARFQCSEKGASATFGIRPEDLSLSVDGDQGGLSGQVLLVELVGSDIFLNIEVAQNITLKVRVPASSQAREGDTVRICMKPKDVHLFDSDGIRIPMNEDFAN
ncbi:MAG: ABC transporter ATP-binding protein [Anaerolineaceae bacterium]|nr:ABC transporter ATP-binding protein [Anaerolineaceae bacterium]